MKVSTVIKKTEKSLKENSPAVLTAIGVSGTISTAYLAGKAGYYAAEDINRIQYLEDRVLDTKEKFKTTWKLYIPAVVSGVVTIVCVVNATRIGTRRTAAAYTLLSVSERAFAEYKDKVVEVVGERKEQTVRDGIAQDRVTNNPPSTKEIFVTGKGTVLCCEMHTGRYFESDMESLRKAENELNKRLLNELYATLSDFYCIVGLPYTSSSDDIGWDSDKLMALKFSTVLSDDGRPCIAFDYNYTKPIPYSSS